MLDTFQNLVKLISRPMLCILDGLEALEDRSDREYTKEWANVLDVLCQTNSPDPDAGSALRDHRRVYGLDFDAGPARCF